MKEYLRSSVDLIKQAAWTFPTFVQRGGEQGKSPVEIMDSQPLSPQDMDALLEHAFARYYGTSALFGTPQRCLTLVDKFRGAGVDEIACLIDFGVATDTVLAHLKDLKALMEASRQSRPAVQRASVAEQIAQNAVTHLQCTPSMASMLVADAAGRAALSRLSVLMVGGEALPLKLAKELRALVPGKLLNMYGPTETTIWSTTCELTDTGRLRRARAADRQHAPGRPHAMGRRMPGPGARRIADRRRRCCPGLLEASRTHGRSLLGRPIAARVAHVPHRRPGAPPSRRRDRIPGPHGPSGEDPGPSHRAGRDRERPGAAGGREGSRGRGARRRHRATNALPPT